VRSVNCDANDVRLVAFSQSANLIGEAQDLSATDGRKFEHGAGGQNGWVSGNSLMEKGSQLHVSQKVERVVGGGAVGSEAELDSAFQ
jgi:hypothetical protein